MSPIYSGYVKVQFKIWVHLGYLTLQQDTTMVVKYPLIIHKVTKVNPNLLALLNILLVLFGVFLSLLPNRQDFGESV